MHDPGSRMRASDFDGSRLGCDSRHSGDLGTPLLLLSCLVLCVTGCSGKLTTDYGESRGRAARRSVNGLGAFRDALAMDVEREEDTREVDFRSSVRTRDLSRLSYRTDRYESIIWTPTAWPPANADSVYTFMENWLKKDARTLVLVLPDAASTESFWEASLKVAPPESRLHHRRRLARSINERLLSDVRLTPITVSDWFRAVPLPYRAKLEDGRSVQYRLAAIPPKPAEQTIIADHSDDTGASDAASEVTADESGDAASSELEATESAKQESAPKPSVYAPKDQTFTPIAWRTDAVTENHVTQAGADALDRVLAARITRTAWGDSRLIVLAGGGLVTNFAMTTMGGRELVGIVHEEIRRVNAKQPEAEKSFFTEADRIDVAFLKSDTMPLPISDAKPQATAASGMEILTTWPMSAITMHGVFVGFLIVLMLSPIFGRPQRLRYNRASDFGNHLDALAKLMRTLGGPTHARERISQYYRRVRGEVGGPWVLPLPEHAPGTTAPSQPVADQTDAALNQKPRSTDSSVE